LKNELIGFLTEDECKKIKQPLTIGFPYIKEAALKKFSQGDFSIFEDLNLNFII